MLHKLRATLMTKLVISLGSLIHVWQIEYLFKPHKQLSIIVSQHKNLVRIILRKENPQNYHKLQGLQKWHPFTQIDMNLVPYSCFEHKKGTYLHEYLNELGPSCLILKWPPGNISELSPWIQLQLQPGIGKQLICS